MSSTLNAYFVSDLHISGGSDPKLHLFISFLKQLKGSENITHLFLLGDIFDLWIAGHNYFINQYQPVIAEIRRLKSEGVEIHYFEGNHDLYLQHFWQKEVGAQVHGEAEYFQLGSSICRLEHGDQMDPEDRGYIFLRWLLRTPFLKWLAPRLPERAIVWFGERASQASRQYTSKLKVIAEDQARRKFRQHVDKVFHQRPFHFLISGHTHVRDDHLFESTIGPVRAINLGSWFDSPAYFKMTTDFQGFEALSEKID